MLASSAKHDVHPSLSIMTKSLMLKDGQLKDGQLGVVQGVGAPVFSGVQPGAVLPHTSEQYVFFLYNFWVERGHFFVSCHHFFTIFTKSDISFE